MNPEWEMGSLLIWDRDNECMPRNEMETLQLHRLQQVVQRVYDRVPHYKQTFDQAGVQPSDLKTLDDLQRFPFTLKDHMRDSFPYGLFAVPTKEVVRLHASSGTTGKATVVGYTKRDLELWADACARFITMAGVTADDTVQIAFGYGLFTGGFGLHYGMERVGATVIPASSGNTERQIQLMKDFGTTALVCTPSYALHMAEVREEMGIPRSDLKLRVGLFGGEPWTEGMRKEIEELWQIEATDNYGLSEIIGPGVSGQCPAGKGLHISEDFFYPELINPETGEPVAPGESGELVLTAMTKEAGPIIRYRTRDITTLDYTPCTCGRTTVRMQKVTGRSDDMLIIRGVNVFPSQIESVLMEIDGVGPHYLIIVERKGYLDEMEVQVELSSEKFSDRYRDLEALEARVRQRLHAVISMNPKVRLVEYKSLERTTGKAKRVIDKRPK